jgi:hypothetical protein
MYSKGHVISQYVRTCILELFCIFLTFSQGLKFECVVFYLLATDNLQSAVVFKSINKKNETYIINKRTCELVLLLHLHSVLIFHLSLLFFLIAIVVASSYNKTLQK